MSAKDRILSMFLESKGEIITNRQIADTAMITSWPRRVRELREEGWPIRSNNDDKTLKPGGYRLIGDLPDIDNTVKRKPLSNRIRTQVLNRDGSVCQMCGAVPGDIDLQFPERKVRLHVDHIRPRSQGGSDELDNLRTLCSSCNQGSKHLMLQPPDYIDVLGKIRNASRAVQLQIFQWLRNNLDEL